MKHACPAPDELLQLLDGELSENRAEVLRAHMRDCPACTRELERHEQLLADLRAPVASASAATLTARVLRRLDEPAPPRRTLLPFWGGSAIVAAAAAALLVVALRPPGGQETLRARGAPIEQLARRTSVDFYVVGDPARKLVAGDAVGVDTAYMVSYRNLEREPPVYLLAFAVDSQQVVHWLHPAYDSLAEDPLALPLAFSADERALPESVVLGHPAAGPLRLITIVTRTRARVSTIEKLNPVQLQPDALAERWPDAAIRMLTVQVAPPIESTRP
jgi:hypothetical protein